MKPSIAIVLNKQSPKVRSTMTTFVKVETPYVERTMSPHHVDVLSYVIGNLLDRSRLHYLARLLIRLLLNE